jgi:hypothetical protein
MLIMLAVGVLLLGVLPAGPSAQVEAEETVYAYAPAGNGAGPMWCYGSTCVLRMGGDVYVSGLETIPGAKILNNCRWTLWKRGPGGWATVASDETGRTREPCPLSAPLPGRLALSVNPTLTPVGTYNGPSRPQVLDFDLTSPVIVPKPSDPAWSGKPAFTEHSYRGLAADGAAGDLLLMNVEGHEGQWWSLRDRSGRWVAAGKLAFPMGVEYEKPEPIRLCYPVLALRNRAAHFMGISDIIEPVRTWREFKRQLTGNEWDYEFRRLFYAWTPDLGKQGFGVPVEVASREATCGQITNLDMWIDKAGRAHLLWLERSVWHAAMRDRFFPGTPLTTSLEYAVVDRGKVVLRSTLARGGEGASSEVPGYGRFHALPGGRLTVLAYMGGSVSENRVLTLDGAGKVTSTLRVPFGKPFTNFMTATERAGGKPSDLIDLIGDVGGALPSMRYGRIRVKL